MSELKLVSPLLDQMSVEEEIAGHNGCTCYALRHVQSGERFVVKRISVPASDLQVRALILSGAYPDDAAVHAYYGSVAEDIKNELDTGMRLAENGYFAGASSYQIEPKESGIGYDVYILYPRMVSLRAFLDHSAMTGLRAVNLGIDPKIMYYGLLCGATLGGNLTPIGASANIAGIGILRKEGHEVKATTFMKYGVPFTLAAVITGYLLIWLIWKP